MMTGFSGSENRISRTIALAPAALSSSMISATLLRLHGQRPSSGMARLFSSTEAPAGSREKLDVLAERVLRGEPLWHPEDRPDYSGLTGAVRPRD